MSDRYVLSRASIVSDCITAGRACELYAEAKEGDPTAGLCGDLETGFCFWSLDVESGLRLVHYSVMPVRADEASGDIRDRECSIAGA